MKWVSQLEPVSQENHPRIYQALKKECEFRGVEIPACYCDPSGRTKLGMGNPYHYTVVIDARCEEIFSDKELRALSAHELKHLYQNTMPPMNKYGIPKAGFLAHIKQHEFDSDRAAVSSTDYETIQSFIDKSVHEMIDRLFPTLTPIRNGLHNLATPNFAERFPLQTSPFHPSPKDRMRAMREYTELSDKERSR